MAMPRQNRVTPFGDIVATPERGWFMGNRGVLHDGEGLIRRPWQLKRWIVCVLEFRCRKRQVMTPGRYTELFFLDEATALAAGHRPCAECRHPRFLTFCHAWRKAHPVKGEGSPPKPTAHEIDNRLHSERLAADHSKRSFLAVLDELPDGVFVVIPAWGEEAYLVLEHALIPWKPGEYGKRRQRPNGEVVQVLTPASTVEAIRAGYAPEIHSSAGRKEFVLA